MTFTENVTHIMDIVKVTKLTKIYGENPRSDCAQFAPKRGSQLPYFYLEIYVHDF